MTNKPDKNGLLEGRDDDFGLYLEAQAKKRAKVKPTANKAAGAAATQKKRVATTKRKPSK